VEQVEQVNGAGQSRAAAPGTEASGTREAWAVAAGTMEVGSS
jgi:hypothetical protein